MNRRLSQDLDRWLTTEPVPESRERPGPRQCPDCINSPKLGRSFACGTCGGSGSLSRTRVTSQRPKGRAPVTSHELRFMRERIEGEPSQTRLHDIALNAIGMLERAVEAEEGKRI